MAPTPQRSPKKNRQGPSSEGDQLPRAQRSPAATSDHPTTTRPEIHAPSHLLDNSANQTPRVLVTLPLANPSTRNTPLFGSLNLRDELFFIKASVQMLKAAIASAPENIRAVTQSNASKEVLLAEVLRLRQQEALLAQSSAPSPQETLQKLVTMNSQEITKLAAENPIKLKSWMKSAMQADEALRASTPNLDSLTTDRLVIKVLELQVQAHVIASSLARSLAGAPATFAPKDSSATARPPQGSSIPRIETAPASHLTHARLASAPPPVSVAHLRPTLEAILAGKQAPTGGQLRNFDTPLGGPDTSDDEEVARAPKKKKVKIDPEGFTFGSSSSTEQTLQYYPGRDSSSNSLNVTELKGPSILAQIIGSGSNIPTFLNQFKHWRKNLTGNPSQSEVEAHTLGRMIHIDLLVHKSPIEALTKRPSLEIGLRRLYAVLFVEEAVNTGAVKDRAAAWKHIQFILESMPQGTVMTDPITEEMTRYLNLEKKRIAAVKAMEETRVRKNRNGQQDNGGNSNTPANRRPNNRQ